MVMIYNEPVIDRVLPCRVCGIAREAIQIGAVSRGERYSACIRIECACGNWFESGDVARLTGATRRDRRGALLREHARMVWNSGK